MIINVTVKARVASRAGASAYLKRPGNAVIADRQGPRWLIMSCPCGCGAELPINLDRRAGPAWRLYESPKGTSVYPSVWRDTDCQSHFIILRNKTLLFGPRGDDWWFDEEEISETELLDRVLETLSARAQSIEEISDQIAGSVPWDVMRCCRKLCRKGNAIEGSGQSKGRFRRNHPGGPRSSMRRVDWFEFLSSSKVTTHHADVPDVRRSVSQNNEDGTI